MKYTVIINACLGFSISDMEDLYGFLISSSLQPEQGTALVFHDPATSPSTLKPIIPISESIFIAVPNVQPDTVLGIFESSLKPYLHPVSIFQDDPFGRQLAVRIAKRLNGSSLTGVHSIKYEARKCRAQKQIYAGQINADFAFSRFPVCVTYVKGTCSPLSFEPDKTDILEEFDFSSLSPSQWVGDIQFEPKKTDHSIEQSKFIVAIGRGVGTAQAFSDVVDIAQQLGADWGISRAAMMNGWAHSDRLIGVSGLHVQPDLCILLGVSGASAFMVGVKRSKYLIAINTDETASVFSNCDVAVSGDCNAIFTELKKLLDVKNS